MSASTKITEVAIVTEATSARDLACDTCLYFEEVSPEHGLCHRYPPDVPNNAYPKVLLSSWCGEHQVTVNN